MELRDEIAEAIWKAEYRRAASKERSVPFEETGSDNQDKYRFVADAILAIPEIAEALRIKKDYDAARLGHTT